MIHEPTRPKSIFLRQYKCDITQTRTFIMEENTIAHFDHVAFSSTILLENPPTPETY